HHEWNKQDVRIVFIIPPVAAELDQDTGINKCHRGGDGQSLEELAREGDTHGISLALSLAEGQSLPTKLVLVRAGKSGREVVKSRFQDGADFRARQKQETANAH